MSSQPRWCTIGYRRKRFYLWTHPSDDHEERLRFEALRTFLHAQPEIQNETWSLPDFEFLWFAAKTSFRSPAPSGVLNLPLQRPCLQDGNRIRWSKSGIPADAYFLEAFSYLRRRDRITTLTNPIAARELLAQPCDLHRQTAFYMDKHWSCIVLTERMDFFATTMTVLTRTACFQQQAWSLDAFSDLWHSIQYASGTLSPFIDLSRTYDGQQWRRRVPTDHLIVAAELLHFLHTRPATSLFHFLRSFDACIYQPASAWEFWCLSAEERQESLRRACAPTAQQPLHYPADSHIHSDDSPQEHRRKTLATAGASWPCAIPPSAHCMHLASYRSNFEAILQPPQVCAFCACAVWNDEGSCLDLRQLPCHLSALHTLLSGQLWLENQAAALRDPLPPHFVPLSLADLTPRFASLPIEMHHCAPVPCFCLIVLCFFVLFPLVYFCFPCLTLRLFFQLRTCGCFIFPLWKRKTTGLLQRKTPHLHCDAMLAPLVHPTSRALHPLCLHLPLPTTMSACHHLHSWKTCRSVSRCLWPVASLSADCAP